MIKTLTGRNAALSNFSAHPVTMPDGITYPTSEHAFQAQKTHDRAEREKIAAKPKPGQAKYAGKRVKLREDWEEIKRGTMKQIVSIKMAQNPDAAETLEATGEEEIQEGNNWNDKYWGVSNRDGKGRNELGKILQEIRAERREEAAQ